MVVALWMGIHGNKAAWNLFVFFQWLTLLIWLMLFSARHEENCFKELPPQAVPARLASFSDLILAALLAASGHFFYASCRILELFAQAGFYSARENRKKKDAA